MENLLAKQKKKKLLAIPARLVDSWTRLTDDVPNQRLGLAVGAACMCMCVSEEFTLKSWLDLNVLSSYSCNWNLATKHLGRGMPEATDWLLGSRWNWIELSDCVSRWLHSLIDEDIFRSQISHRPRELSHWTLEFIAADHVSLPQWSCQLSVPPQQQQQQQR